MNFNKYFISSLIAGFVVALDQATKIYVHTQVPMGKILSIVPGFLNISYVRNQGGAFGLFSESSPVVRHILFLLFPIFCVFLILTMIKETNNKVQIFALGSILGGAVGNYLDRVRFGYVVDFLDCYIRDFHWPTFNIADSFIVMGVCTLLFFYRTEKSESHE